MTRRLDDDALRRRYQAFLASHRRFVDGPELSVEIIEALVSGRYHGADRLDLLDRILANPATAREFHFLEDLARNEPATADRIAPWMAIAAVALIAVGIGTAWRWIGGGREPVRGSSAGVTIVTPGPGDAIGPDVAIVWQRAAGDVVEYRMELSDASGEVVLVRTTTDTTAVIPADLVVAEGSEYVLTVVTRFTDGTSTRSRSLALRGR